MNKKTIKGETSTAVLAVMTVVGLGLAGYSFVKNYNANPSLTTVTIEQPTTVTMNNNVVSKVPPDVQVGSKKIKQLNLDNSQVVTIYGEIGEESYSVAKNITELGKSGKPIYVLLNSPGGSVLDGALIVSAIESSSVPVYTIVEGLCASMCQIIHAYGTKRMMADRTVLMGHPASGGIQGTLEQMQSRLGMIQRYVNKFNAYIAKRAGIPLDKYLAMVVSEMWLDAEDATAMNFNDEIVNVHLKVQPVDPISILGGDKKRNDKQKVDIKW